MDNVLVIDNLLSQADCDLLIKEGSTNMSQDVLNTSLGYEWTDWTHESKLLNDITASIVNSYCNKFPQITMTADKWCIPSWRFKHFPPGYHFSDWHSEHVHNEPYRIACIILYLSDHDCGTEFYDGEVVGSKIGRAMMFPTFWTHMHRGQVCPQNKHRYIMSAYAHLTKGI